MMLLRNWKVRLMMMHKTFNEWQQGKDNIFEVMNTISPLPFLSADMTVDNLLLSFKLNYGDRLMPSAYDLITVNEAASLLIMRYYKNWQDVTELFNIEYPMDVNSIVTETEIVSDSGAINQTDETINKESAYNDIDFIDVDSRTDTTNKDTENNRERTYEQSRKSLQAMMLRRTMLEKDVLLDVVFRNMANEMTLSIY